MAKTREIYVCSGCGARSFQWHGQCPSCGEWNTLQPVAVRQGSPGSASPAKSSVSQRNSPQTLESVTCEGREPYPSGIAALDRVLGSGLVPGAAILLGGEPGIGKSTLLLQVAGSVSARGQKVLYASGEESLPQVRARAERLGLLNPRLMAMSTSSIEEVIAGMEEEKPALLILDSVQTMASLEAEGLPGNVSQVKAVATLLIEACRRLSVTGVIVGHVTKDGTLAGPRVLEHIVDTVLYFEGERNAEYRVLRAVKNRFGSTNELGLFEMRDVGLVDVPDASKLFLSDREQDTGTVIIPTVEGTRPLLVELQALVAPTPYVPPRRTADSVDIKRIQLLLAVLEKRVHLSVGACDVYVKVAGGIRIDEPAADLGICVAMASSFANRLLRPKTIVFGEVGLSGEVRAVSQADLRIHEAKRLGFRHVVLPMKNYRQLKGSVEGITLYGAETIGDALRLAMPRES